VAELRERLIKGASSVTGRGKALHDLTERVKALEAENVELRRHGMRLAELMDVVEELLVPLAARDEDKIDEAVAAFRRSL
jgi:hypothetical protein